MWWLYVLGYIVWVVVGAVSLMKWTELECKAGGGSCEPPPCRWWHWPVGLGFFLLLTVLIILSELCCAWIWLLSFGMIDLDF